MTKYDKASFLDRIKSKSLKRASQTEVRGKGGGFHRLNQQLRIPNQDDLSSGRTSAVVWPGEVWAPLALLTQDTLHVNEYGFHSIYNYSNIHLHSCSTTTPSHGTEDNDDIWNHFCFNINLPWIYADDSMFPIEASTLQRHPTILQFFSGYTKSNFHFYLIFHRISWYDVKTDQFRTDGHD